MALRVTQITPILVRMGKIMRQVARESESDNQLLFLPGVFNETLALLFDAHQYFQARGIEDQSSLRGRNRNNYSTEMSRVTMRLTSVMAWIMVRRAIHAGRIDEGKAASDYRLDGREICLDDGMLDDMPYYLTYLSDRSRDLYARVDRLDRLAYGHC